MLTPFEREARIAELMSNAPTPPGSPAAGDDELGTQLAVTTGDLNEEEAGLTDEAVQLKNKARHSSGEAEFRRSCPWWDNLKSAYADLSLRKVPTLHGGVNNCLCFSYMVGSGELAQDKQK